jgi:peptidoglycan/xylan/chitin deacetylase (PgdA/CDA1 family)
VVDTSMLLATKATGIAKPTIFVFHSVTNSPQVGDAHRVSTFDHFLRWLIKQTKVSSNWDASCNSSSVASDSRRPRAALTFDDGFLDHYTVVFPMLQRYGLTGTFFIPTGLVGRPNGVDRRMIREMSDYGMTIGGHSVTHCHLPDCTASQLRRELTDSKIYLEDLTGRECAEFAYPYGHYNELVKLQAKEAGYKLAFAGSPSPVRGDRWSLPRTATPDAQSSWSYNIALFDARCWRRALRRSPLLDRFFHCTLGYQPERLEFPMR